MTLKKVMFANVFLVCFLLQQTSLLGQSPSTEYVEKVKINASSMTFEFNDAYRNFTIEITGPEDFYLKKEIKDVQSWTLNSTGFDAEAFANGGYQLQITPNFEQSKAEQKVLRYLTETDQIAQLKAKKELLNIPIHVQSYNRSFRITDGTYVLPRNEAYGLKLPQDNNDPTANLSKLRLAANAAEPTFTNLFNAPKPSFAAFFHTADGSIEGSLCVGLDCVSTESFSFDTQRFKENNLRIHFDDTSSSASFPSNDWRITANDSSNGGSSYLAFEDATAGTVPFRVRAGSGNNAIYVSSSGGNVGFGTASPVVEVQVTDGDSPTMRLEQNGSNGWTPQTWDVAGNETNFFIRDVTGGSKLPFKIRPGAPDNSIYIQTTGHVGLGTANPAEKLHVESGNIHLAGDMLISGSTKPISDRRLKKDIKTIEDGLATIQKLNATTYNFRKDKYPEMNLSAGTHYGFIAQELQEVIPALVFDSSNPDKDKNFKRVNYTGVIPFLVKGMQEQQAIIDNQQTEIDALKAQLNDMDALKAQVAALAKMIEVSAEQTEEGTVEKDK